MTSREPSGLTAALMAFGACALLSIVLWFPLSLPTRILEPFFLLAASANVALGPVGAYLVPVGLGVLTLVVPLVLTGLVFVFRKRLGRVVTQLTPHLPVESRFLVAPAVATTVFLITWAGSHYQVATQLGLLPQILFPAVIGLFVFATSRYGPEIQARMSSFFAFRSKLPRLICLAAAIAIPLLVGIVLNDPVNTSFAPHKQQFIVVLGLTTGFLALAPVVAPGSFTGLSSGQGKAAGDTDSLPQDSPYTGSSLVRLIGFSFGAALIADLVFSEVVLAQTFWYCQCDLTRAGGYNVAVAMGGGAAGLAAGAVASSLGGGPTIRDLDGNPLPRWSPDAPPGYNGYAGQPGDVLVEGNWEDPGYARDRMGELRERQKELEATWADVQEKSTQWLHDRHQQNEAEAAAERKVRQDATDTLERIRQISKRRGYDDILERADGVAVNPDGSVNVDYVDRLKKTLSSRIGMEVAAPHGTPTTSDWITEGLMMSSREVFTGVDADGNTSYKSFVLRGLAGIASGGSSEYVYTPVDSMYRMKDGVDRGESGATLFGKAVAGAIADEMIGRAMGGAISKVGGYVAKKFPGLTKTVSEYADDIYKKLNKPIGGAKPSALAPNLAGKKAALQAALDSGDDDAVRALYKNGGMDDLAKLESGGHISPAQAKRLNSVLTDTTDGAVDIATKKTLSQFKDDTGVKVDEMLIGDSGSSSRAMGPRSVRTDADRTLVSRFNQADLDAYARRNNISVDEAYDTLSEKLTGMQQSNIDEALKGRGLTATDVDCKCYDRIGGGAGQSDCYPEGFTNARQAQGRTTVYATDADGNLSRSYQTSGQATVDQNHLMKAEFGSADVTVDPTRVGGDELPKLLEQQKMSAAGHSDAKSLAKSVMRSDYVAGRVGQPMGNPDLVDVAGKIAANPQGQNAILQSHGMTESQFVSRARDMVANYAPEMPI